MVNRRIVPFVRCYLLLVGLVLKPGIFFVRRAVSGTVLTDFGKAACVGLLLVLSCALSPAFAQAASAGCTPAGGSGTGSSPYRIATLCELQGISLIPTAHYLLVADIDASETEDWNAGAGFRPIASGVTVGFSGSFRNNGNHAISSLTINRDDEQDVGLFSRLAAGAEIRGIMLVGSRTTGGDYVGSLVGRSDEGVIEGCSATGSVFGGRRVGGLVGAYFPLQEAPRVRQGATLVGNSYAAVTVSGDYNVGGLVGLFFSGGSINNSYATGSVFGTADRIGGLVGRAEPGAFLSVSPEFQVKFPGSINSSSATGSVSGRYYVGGLVGEINTHINDSYATGSVSGAEIVGGLVGDVVYSVVSDSYATGSVFGTADRIGGLVGREHSSSIVNSYAIGSEVSGKNRIGGLVGENVEGFISDSYATGSVDGDDYVGGLVGREHSSSIVNSYAIGSEVSGKNRIGGLVGENVEGFISDSYATGSVDGQNMVGGLVGNNVDGVISDSSATGSEVSGQLQVGGLVGILKGSRVINSYATGSEVSGKNQVGGLVGFLQESRVINSYATGSVVSGQLQVGGLVGILKRTMVTNSYATGSVFGREQVGGLVGNQGINSNIRDSSATGSVVGSGDNSRIIGGLVGYLYPGSRLSNSYATGSVFGGEHVGGLVGDDEGGTISNSYATGSVDGQNNVGGLLGESTGDVNNSYATGSVFGIGNEVSGLVGGRKGGNVANSYYAARGRSNELGTERTFTQLRCPTMSSAVCGLSGSDQRTYDGWDTSVWDFGSATELPQLLGNRNPELNLKPYAKGSADLVAVIDFTGTTQFSLMADYLGPPGEPVTLTWSLFGVPTEPNHLAYFDLGGGTTSTTFTDSRKPTDGASTATLVVASNAELVDRSFYVVLKNNISANDDRIRVQVGVEQPYIRSDGIRQARADGITTLSFSVANAGPAEQPVTLTWSLSDLPTSLRHLIYFELADGTTSATVTDSGKLVGSAITVTLVVVGNEELADRSFYVVLKNNISVHDDRVLVRFARLSAGCVPSGGSGSEDDPYQIGTLCQLQGIGSSSPTAHYKLVADIDASGTEYWNNGAGFRPIALDVAGGFSGSFGNNGNYVISSLTISRSDTNNVGLFSRLAENGEIEGIRLVGSRTTGGVYVGSLVGSSKGVIKNSYVMAGSVSGSHQIGGLVGLHQGDVISNSYASCLVSGADGVGGLVGYNLGSISGSFATGSVSGSGRQVGGLVGYLDFRTDISVSYATGSVSGVEEVGGLVGESRGDISDSYSTGSVFGDDYVGGLVGQGGENIANSYYVARGQNNDLGEERTFAQLRCPISPTYENCPSDSQENTYGGWDADVWDFGSATDLPQLWSNQNAELNLKPYVKGYTDSVVVIGFTGIAELPIVVDYPGPPGVPVTLTWSLSGVPTSLRHSVYFDLGGGTTGATVTDSRGPMDGASTATFVVVGNEGLSGRSFYVVLKNSVSANDDRVRVQFAQDSAGCVPSGGSGSEAVPYQIGTLCELQGIGSSNLTAHYKLVADIDASGTKYWNDGAGFRPIALDVTGGFSGSFVSTGNYVISSLTISRSGTSHVGLFSRLAENGEIEGIRLDGSRMTGLNFVGSLVGYNDGVIENSHAFGSVSGVEEVGGLVGVNSGDISVSYATGSVSGIKEVGGLVGESSGDISDSYATGSVFGDDYVGGLVGTVTILGSIGNSYATGSVFGDDYVGGLVGQGDGNIANSYYVARGPNNDLGEERTFAQLRCRTVDTSANCLPDFQENTYEDWDASVWNFGNATELPQLRSNRNSELNLKPYVEGSADLVVVIGFTGITELPIVADYPGPPGVPVILAWSLSGVPSSLRHLVYLDLGGGTTGTTVTDSRGPMDGASTATLVLVGNEVLAGKSFYVVLKNNVSANDDRVRIRSEVEQPYIRRNDDIRLASVEGITTLSFSVANAGPTEQPVTLTWSLSGVPTSLSHLIYFELADGMTSTTVIDSGKLTGSASSVTLVVVGNEELAGRSVYVVLKNNVSINDDRVQVRVEGHPPDILRGGGIHPVPIGRTTTFNFFVGYTGSPVPVTLTWSLFSETGLPSDSVYFNLADGSTSTTFVDSAVRTNNASTVTLVVVGNESLAGSDFYVVLKNNVSVNDDRVLVQFVHVSAGCVPFGGAGSKDDPYQIGTLCELQGIGSGSPAAHYKLIADIDASGTEDWNNGAGFRPIALDVMGGFSGSFVNASNYEISSLTINRSSKDYVGLFSVLAAGATIRGIILADSRTTGDSNVGSLVGISNGGVIEGCSATGSVSGRFYVGGLVGAFPQQKDPRVRQGVTLVGNSFAAVTVSGVENVGGLVGLFFSGGSINNSYATGLVSGSVDRSDYVGGLVGRMVSGLFTRDNPFVYERLPGSINNSSATGLVSGFSSIGGLVGENDANINDSYATGSVLGRVLVGGLVGSSRILRSVVMGQTYKDYSGISNSYATGSVSGAANIGGFAGQNHDDISNSYASGSVFGQINVGGFVGIQYADTTIRDSYATGSVFGDDSVGGLVGQQSGGSTIRDSYATGSVFGDGSVGGLVGLGYGNTANSYYAARGQNNDWGTERTFKQLRCPAMSSETCSLSGSDQRTYEDWDTNVWDFGTATELPQLSRNRNSELNLKPYVKGSADSVAEIGLTGITQLPLVADYPGPPSESVTLTWSLLDVPISLRHLVYFDLGGGTTSTTFTALIKPTDSTSTAPLVAVGNEELSGRSFYVVLKNNVAANNDRIRVLTKVKQPYISLADDIRLVSFGSTTTFSFSVAYAGPAEQPVTLTWSLSGVPTSLSHLVYFELADGTTSTAVTDSGKLTGGAIPVMLVVVGNEELAGRSFYVVLKNNVSANDDRVQVLVGVGSPNIYGDDDRPAAIGRTTTLSFSVGYTGSAVPVTLTWSLPDLPTPLRHLVYFNLADGSTSTTFVDSSVRTNNASRVTLEIVGNEGLAGRDFYVVLKNDVSANDDRVRVQFAQVSAGCVPSGGSGSRADPYQIGTLCQLQGIGSGSPTAHYKLVADIDASETEGWNNGAGFRPIALDVTGGFSGSFVNASNYEISSLTISRSSKNYVGLFSRLAAGATIRGIILADSRTIGRDVVGSLVGTSNGGVIEGCSATGSVSGRFYVGGLAGEMSQLNARRGVTLLANSSAAVTVFGLQFGGGLVARFFGGASINNSYATGSVGGGRNLGGLVSSFFGGGSINNSYATGSVSGVTRVGGLSAYFRGSMNNSYATGSVSGVQIVGGLVGESRGDIINSYATGSVAGTGDNIGGLVGYQEANSNISDSYATGSVFGVQIVGGLVGESRGDIINSYATGSVAGTGDNIGGLVGYQEANSNISDSYATGSVFGVEDVGGLTGYQEANSSISDSYATGAVFGSDYVGGLVGWSTNSSTIRNSYYAARGRDNGFGEERTFTQLRCPTMSGASCSPDSQETYVNWGMNVWDFGSVTDLPQLLSNRSLDLNRKPYIKGSIDLVVGTGYPGITRFSLEADYPGTPVESVVLTWSLLFDELFTLRDFIYFELEDGTTSTEANGSVATLAAVRDDLMEGKGFYVVLKNNISVNDDRVRVDVEEEKKPYILRDDDVRLAEIEATTTFSLSAGYAGSAGIPVTLTWSLSGVPTTLRHLVYFDLGGGTTSTTVTDPGKITDSARTVTLVVVGNKELAGRSFYVVLENDISVNDDRVLIPVGEEKQPYILRDDGIRLAEIEVNNTFIFSAGYAGPPGVPVTLTWSLSGVPATLRHLVYFDLGGGTTSTTFTDSAKLTDNASTVTLVVVGNEDLSGRSFYVVLKNDISVNDDRVRIGVGDGCAPEMKVKEGSGSRDDPYEIETLCQLHDISSNPFAHYLLVADVDGSMTKDWNGGKGFEPIALDVMGGFSGSFVNAGNNVIRSLTISRSDIDNVGLFSELAAGATIRGIMLVGSRTTGRDNVGSLVGINRGGVIEDFSTTGSVSGREQVGGLVGYQNTGSIISSSSATGSVIGTSHAIGGLVGRQEGNSSIRDSSAAGTAIGGSRIGGLVGENGGGISDSYAMGLVSGQNNTGGLVGHLENVSSISGSYATGSVVGSGIRTGGLVGYQEANSSISDSYATGTVFGVEDIGGLTGYQEANSSISDSYATGTVFGSDYVGGLVGRSANTSAIRNSYYAARGRDNGFGEERTFTQLRCPTMSGASCSPDSQETYVNWDMNVWDFGSVTDLPQLLNNRSLDLNRKPYIKGSIDLVVGTGYPGITRFSLEADYPGTPVESVVLTWSLLFDELFTLSDFIYFELEDGTTSTKANGSAATLAVVRDDLMEGKGFYVVLKNNISVNDDRVLVDVEEEEKPYILRGDDIRLAEIESTTTFNLTAGYAGPVGQAVDLTWALSGVPATLRHLVYFDLGGGTTSTTFTDSAVLTDSASTATLVVVGNKELAGRSFYVVLGNNISVNDDRVRVDVGEEKQPYILRDGDIRQAMVEDTTTFSLSAGYAGSPGVSVTLTWSLSGVPATLRHLVYFDLGGGTTSTTFTDSGVLTDSASTATLVVVGNKELAGRSFYVVLGNNISVNDDLVRVDVGDEKQPYIFRNDDIREARVEVTTTFSLSAGYAGTPGVPVTLTWSLSGVPVMLRHLVYFDLGGGTTSTTFTDSAVLTSSASTAALVVVGNKELAGRSFYVVLGNNISVNDDRVRVDVEEEKQPYILRDGDIRQAMVEDTTTFSLSAGYAGTPGVPVTLIWSLSGVPTTLRHLVYFDLGGGTTSTTFTDSAVLTESASTATLVVVGNKELAGRSFYVVLENDISVNDDRVRVDVGEEKQPYIFRNDAIREARVEVNTTFSLSASYAGSPGVSVTLTWSLSGVPATLRHLVYFDLGGGTTSTTFTDSAVLTSSASTATLVVVGNKELAGRSFYVVLGNDISVNDDLVRVDVGDEKQPYIFQNDDIRQAMVEGNTIFSFSAGYAGPVGQAVDLTWALSGVPATLRHLVYFDLGGGTTSTTFTDSAVLTESASTATLVVVGNKELAGRSFYVVLGNNISVNDDLVRVDVGDEKQPYILRDGDIRQAEVEGNTTFSLSVGYAGTPGVPVTLTWSLSGVPATLRHLVYFDLGGGTTSTTFTDSAKLTDSASTATLVVVGNKELAGRSFYVVLGNDISVKDDRVRVDVGEEKQPYILRGNDIRQAEVEGNTIFSFSAGYAGTPGVPVTLTWSLSGVPATLRHLVYFDLGGGTTSTTVTDSAKLTDSASTATLVVVGNKELAGRSFYVVLGNDISVNDDRVRVDVEEEKQPYILQNDDIRQAMVEDTTTFSLSAGYAGPVGQAVDLTWALSGVPATLRHLVYFDLGGGTTSTTFTDSAVLTDSASTATLVVVGNKELAGRSFYVVLGNDISVNDDRVRVDVGEEKQPYIFRNDDIREARVEVTTTFSLSAGYAGTPGVPVTLTWSLSGVPAMLRHLVYFDLGGGTTSTTFTDSAKLTDSASTATLVVVGNKELAGRSFYVVLGNDISVNDDRVRVDVGDEKQPYIFRDSDIRQAEIEGTTTFSLSASYAGTPGVPVTLIWSLSGVPATLRHLVYFDLGGGTTSTTFTDSAVLTDSASTATLVVVGNKELAGRSFYVVLGNDISVNDDRVRVDVGEEKQPYIFRNDAIREARVEVNTTFSLSASYAGSPGVSVTLTWSLSGVPATLRHLVYFDLGGGTTSTTFTDSAVLTSSASTATLVVVGNKELAGRSFYVVLGNDISVNDDLVRVDVGDEKQPYIFQNVTFAKLWLRTPPPLASQQLRGSCGTSC